MYVNMVTITAPSLTVFDELEYFPIISRLDKILYDSAKKSIERLGESVSKVLLDHICSVYGLSETELLTNYDLFEKSLCIILRKAADIILHDLKKEMLVHAVLMDPTITTRDILNPLLTVGDILKRIRAAETLEFIRNIPSHQHVAFLYNNEVDKDRVLSSFIGTDSPKGLLLSAKSTKLNSDRSSRLYGELLKYQQDETLKILSDRIANLYSLNTPKNNSAIRIVNEDAGWWLCNGSSNDHIRFEQSLGRCVEDNMSFLCAYNASKFDNSYLKTIIGWHGYVIVDEPFTVYKVGQGGGRI